MVPAPIFASFPARPATDSDRDGNGLTKSKPKEHRREARPKDTKVARVSRQKVPSSEEYQRQPEAGPSSSIAFREVAFDRSRFNSDHTLDPPRYRRQASEFTSRFG